MAGFDSPRQRICEVGRRIWQRRLCAGSDGNITLRLPENPEHILCTPTSVSKGFMQPDWMVVCDLDRQVIEPSPAGCGMTSEIALHLEIYRHRPDVGAVIHAHPPHALAFAITDMPIPQGIHPEAEFFLGQIAHVDFAMPGTRELPDAAARQLTDQTTTLLLRHHGSVSLGTDLEQAWHRLEVLDQYCHALMLARGLGCVQELDATRLKQIMEAKNKAGLSDDRVHTAQQGSVTKANARFMDHPR